jgi:hypothetical protein
VGTKLHSFPLLTLRRLQRAKNPKSFLFVQVLTGGCLIGATDGSGDRWLLCSGHSFDPHLPRRNPTASGLYGATGEFKLRMLYEPKMLDGTDFERPIF